MRFNRFILYGMAFLCLGAILGFALYQTKKTDAATVSTLPTPIKDSETAITQPAQEPTAAATAATLTPSPPPILTAAQLKEQALAKKREQEQLYASIAQQTNSSIVKAVPENSAVPNASGATAMNGSFSGEASINESQMAYFASQEFVGGKLPSPATAKWPLDSDITSTKIASGKYRVEGFVDAENNFGTMLRYYFVAVMRKNGGSWLCNDVEVSLKQP